MSEITALVGTLGEGSRFKRKVDGKFYQITRRVRGDSPMSAKLIVAQEIRPKRVLWITYGWATAKGTNGRRIPSVDNDPSEEVVIL